ncbi:Non-hem dioxygenase N-terminal domain [Arabidopsis thaliana x Arabidopsis arenosa]|jgi:isopenicillin N synthase-like dioxygenase|uniref:2-oxoglutarate (2OG) and Fe(II)-dependent oxygenase superfamily protein n=2 Tax=Arabidopsis TaxID=3701 RepID=A0A1P8AQW5_ARATH|nr:2-oxoglutarate (2OG) and Fe(II)-dependent oxygenase superfamily protein [Arabidopsis thaliana]ANM59043.1 2-oxoglutarate (2OG) and Fe(II)-dependent oxygenase superfamily protein [Arabidopsis thaliana]KAG7644930.1 Non-hem dioxygenase N-terminal domain [Arabidopsis thaliana x Arabidopsis arenosa]|eukprot:NP_001321437.1 2-oxoglutarate (2OG) and Fe(II)-dependent oxygenase superfamily protein [Arabidopsis thaliana]
MESTDRSSQAKAFDEAKIGVKGLVDSGITEIPALFRATPATLASLKSPPPPKHLTIPTVDLKGASVVEKIGEAAEKWGLFHLVNHGIPVEVLERMIQGIRGFHEQEPEAKKRFYSRDHTRDVLYFSNHDLQNSEAASWRDTLGCYTAPEPPRLEDLPAVCGEIMLEYSKEIMSLGERLFELLSEALGLNSHHLKDMDCAKSQYMVGQHYPPCPQPDLTIGINKHTDISFLTVLLQDNVGGLQVFHEQYWIDVTPVPGALVINIGDFLQVKKIMLLLRSCFISCMIWGLILLFYCVQLITNDKFISAEHRVIANGSSEPRTSVAIVFSTFMRAYSRVYGPIKDLLSAENPAKYRDCTLTEFSTIFSSKTLDAPKLHHFKI